MTENQAIEWLKDSFPDRPGIKAISTSEDTVFVDDLFTDATTEMPIPINVDSFIGSSFAVLGTSGFGKTMTVKAIISKLYCKVHIPFSIFDIEGEYWPLRTHHPEIRIMGNSEPLHPEAARNIARSVVETNTPIIFDSSETDNDQYYIFMLNYLLAIRDLARQHKLATSNPMPHILVFDEADLVIPRENRFGTSDFAVGRKLRALLRDVSKRGRKKGICCLFASQRVTELDSTTIAQLAFRLLHKVTGENDAKRYCEWLPINKTDVEEKIKRMRKGEVLYNVDKVQLDAQGRVVIPYYKVAFLSWANVSKSTTLKDVKKLLGGEKNGRIQARLGDEKSSENGKELSESEDKEQADALSV
jgi:hypothetical protein